MNTYYFRHISSRRKKENPSPRVVLLGGAAQEIQMTNKIQMPKSEYQMNDKCQSSNGKQNPNTKIQMPNECQSSKAK